MDFFKKLITFLDIISVFRFHYYMCCNSYTAVYSVFDSLKKLPFITIEKFCNKGVFYLNQNARTALYMGFVINKSI